jgi:fructose 1,6-bisphosphate aldolase/phosphatase
MVEEAQRAIDQAKGDLLIDGQVSWCGDDPSLIMIHTHGPESEAVHSFAWNVFMATTEVAKDLGLYAAGQDLLSDAFSGNLRGMGPGYAGIEIEERPSEPVLCFLADKTEPGAWNLPVYRIFADPFNTAGLVIDPKMHDRFLFEIHDLHDDKRILLDCPSEIYELLLFIGSPARYVVKRVISKALGEVAAVTSTQRLSADGWPVRGQGRPGHDRAVPVRTPGGGRGPGAVRVRPHGGGVHARVAPRADHAGLAGAGPPRALRRASPRGVPRVPAE